MFWVLSTSLTLSTTASIPGILIFLQFFKYIWLFQTSVSYINCSSVWNTHSILPFKIFFWGIICLWNFSWLLSLQAELIILYSVLLLCLLYTCIRCFLHHFKFTWPYLLFQLQLHWPFLWRCCPSSCRYNLTVPCLSLTSHFPTLTFMDSLFDGEIAWGTPGILPSTQVCAAQEMMGSYCPGGHPWPMRSRVMSKCFLLSSPGRLLGVL